MLILRYEANEPRNILSKLKWRRAHTAGFWFELRLAHNEGLEFRQTINSAISYCLVLMPADCLGKGVKGEADDQDAEILYEKEKPEQRQMYQLWRFLTNLGYTDVRAKTWRSQVPKHVETRRDFFHSDVPWGFLLANYNRPTNCIVFISTTYARRISTVVDRADRR